VIPVSPVVVGSDGWCRNGFIFPDDSVPTLGASFEAVESSFDAI
jgi:hypothetical protein